MPHDLEFTQHFNLRQSVHVVCAVFVLFYIAFDVLDLDLSDFPLQQMSHRQVVIVAEAPQVPELFNLLDRDSPRIGSLFIDPSISKESFRFRHQRVLQVLWLHIARAQIYRITFPRSSTTDSSPAV